MVMFFSFFRSPTILRMLGICTVVQHFMPKTASMHGVGAEWKVYVADRLTRNTVARKLACAGNASR